MKMNGGSKTNLKKLNGMCIIMTEIRNGELKMKRKKRKIRFIEAYTVLGELAKARPLGLALSHYD